MTAAEARKLTENSIPVARQTELDEVLAEIEAAAVRGESRIRLFVRFPSTMEFIKQHGFFTDRTTDGTEGRYWIMW